MPKSKAAGSSASPFGAKVLAHAQQYVGTSEHPLGSNHGPLVDVWCKKAAGVHGGIPWCACFAWNMALDCGKKLRMGSPAAVLSWSLWAYKTKRVVQRPFRGDFILYSWNGATPHPDDHMGIVERVLALPRAGNSRRYLVRTIEGNTLGGVVARRWRWVKSSGDYSSPSTPHVVFIRVF